MISKIISTNPAIMADEIQRLKEGTKQFDALRSLSAKNLNFLPYQRESGWEGGGITYTYDNTGIVTTNGTATANSSFACHPRSVSSSEYDLILPNGMYRLSGGVDENHYVYSNVTKSGSAYLLGRDEGGGVTIKLEGSDSMPDGFTKVSIFVGIASGTTVTDYTIKPMLELVTLDNPEAFQEWSMTNSELTKIVNALKCKETTAGSYYLTATVNSEGAITYSWEVIE